MTLCLIAAMDENRVIGFRGRLPWRLPDDLKRFKRLTWGHPLILGRKTYESIGRPLPGRQMIVVTRQPDYAVPGPVRTAADLQQALQTAGRSARVFVGGGAEIYRQTLPLADRLYLTKVQVRVEGDRYFPEIDCSRWRLVREEPHPVDRKHQFPFVFQDYRRV